MFWLWVELAMLVWGLVCLCVGKFAFSANHVVSGARARIMGVLLMLPFSHPVHHGVHDRLHSGRGEPRGAGDIRCRVGATDEHGVDGDLDHLRREHDAAGPGSGPSSFPVAPDRWTTMTTTMIGPASAAMPTMRMKIGPASAAMPMKRTMTSRERRHADEEDDDQPRKAPPCR